VATAATTAVTGPPAAADTIVGIATQPIAVAHTAVPARYAAGVRVVAVV